MQTRNGKTYLDAAPDGNENIYPYMWLKSHKSQRKRQIDSKRNNHSLFMGEPLSS